MTFPNQVSNYFKYQGLEARICWKFYSANQNSNDVSSHISQWLSSKSLQTMSTGEGVEKRGPSYTFSGNVNWYSLYREIVSLKKLGIKLPYDPTVPLLGIYPEKTMIEKDRCTPVFTAALPTIARTWKQLDIHRQMNG